MNLDNISDEQYKALYNRIKTDLYNEFINPETATYGLDVIRQEEAKNDIYAGIVAEQDIIKDEIEELTLVMKKYENDEEYEHAAFMKKRIDNLKKRLKKYE